MQIESIIQQARPLVERAWPVVKRALHAVSKLTAELTAPPKVVKINDWQIDFGKVAGKAGEIKTLEIEPQRDFRGEKIMATDTAAKPGMGTRIRMILVGDRMQRPYGPGTLTAFFSSGTFGNGTLFDMCRAGLKIQMEVEFIEDCEFDCTVFGKVVAQ